MKHVFTIHSNLTFLIAYTIIENLKLKRDDIILISSTYKVPLNGYNVYPSFAEKNNKWNQKIAKLNTPKHYDRYLNKILNDKPFIAYIDLMFYYQKILITNKNCQEFHFFEEGNSAYQEFDDLKDITWPESKMKFRNNSYGLKSIIRVLRGYNLRLLSLPYTYSAYLNIKGIKFYSFSKNAFFNAPIDKKVLIKPNDNDKNILKLAGNFRLDNQVIWLDGSNSRFTKLPEKYYYDAIEKAVQVLKKKEIIKSKVYVKLRPGIKDYSQNKLVLILEKNKINIEVLPDDMILECLFMVSSNCHVVGTLTAALEYAHVFGHKAYSIYGLFEKKTSTFFDRMTGFWKNIENLNKN